MHNCSVTKRNRLELWSEPRLWRAWKAGRCGFGGDRAESGLNGIDQNLK